MEYYRVTQDSPGWLMKAYDYVRTDAFVFGQGIPLEMEFAHDDIEALEAVVLMENHKPLAGCRITYPREGIGKIGRVCVIREKQKNGVGHLLISAAEEWIAEGGIKHIVINSQDRAAAFYEKCGYHLVPGVNPEIYENYKPQTEKIEKKEAQRKSLGFSCVLMEKYL